ncbi:DUF5919 domain-containing protein [Micromonospora sp. NPDC047467]|uniref:DUF5919 domain-containing protein n=1 Tax=Micromonospora sp. NPDC047467 TaxID=3154814 RepID=UPI0033D9E3F2
MSVTLGLLGLFSVVDADVLGAATLATLGLVAMQSSHNRSQVSTLAAVASELVAETRQRLLDRPSADLLLSVAAPGTDLGVAHATDIRIVGVTLGRTLRSNALVLQRRIEQGALVRIALVEPHSDAVQEAARRAGIPHAPQIFQHRLQPTIDLLRHLAGQCGHTGRVEVRLLGFVPAFGLFLVDPDEPHGQMQVDLYSHRLAGIEPTLTLRADRDPQSFRHFEQEFERIWSAGRSLHDLGEHVRQGCTDTH